MAPDRVAVDFEPMAARVEVAAGSSVMDAARLAGVGIASTCGGEGSCGRCRVTLLGPDLPAPSEADLRFLSPAEIGMGQRLACRTPVTAERRVHVPTASLVTGQRLQLDGPPSHVPVDAAVRAFEVEAEPPSLIDPRSDLDRVLSALDAAGVPGLAADPAVVRQLTPLVRRTGWRVAAYVRDRDIVGFEAPGRSAVGLAVDLGTTKIAGYLVDLATGDVLAAEGLLNPQISRGEDVIARLAHAARDSAGAEDLARTVRAGLDGLAGSLAATAGAARDQIADAVIVGNTAMHHLLLGLPVRQLALAPFVAAASGPLDVRAADLGLALAPDCRIHFLPCIGGFVGADATAMVIATDLDRLDRVALGIDIGTNTEIVLRRPGVDGLVAASCASGPAFEGGHIRDGMRAGDGAIERVRLDGPAPEVEVIGGVAPLGICGSGVVDAVAELRRTGCIDHRGRFVADAPGVSRGDAGALQFDLVGAARSGTGREIAITQGDVREIQLAKGAIAAGIGILLDATQTPPEAVTEVIVAGAFGTYLDLDSALAIGLLPRLSNARCVQVGNAAGTGARSALLSLRERERARGVARHASYLDLTSYEDFHRRFAHSMLFDRPVTRSQ